jgi:hypothetical protein
MVEWMRTDTWYRDKLDLGMVVHAADKWRTSQKSPQKSPTPPPEDLPPGFVMLPGEVAEPWDGGWKFTNPDGRKRAVHPRWHGVVWDSETYREDRRQFDRDVEAAKITKAEGGES